MRSRGLSRIRTGVWGTLARNRQDYSRPGLKSANQFSRREALDAKKFGGGNQVHFCASLPEGQRHRERFGGAALPSLAKPALVSTLLKSLPQLEDF